jgi:hypothetical protein
MSAKRIVSECDPEQLAAIKNAPDRLLLYEAGCVLLPGETVSPYGWALLEELMERYWIAKGRFP